MKRKNLQNVSKDVASWIEKYTEFYIMVHKEDVHMKMNH